MSLARSVNAPTGASAPDQYQNFLVKETQGWKDYAAQASIEPLQETGRAQPAASRAIASDSITPGACPCRATLTMAPATASAWIGR